MAKRDGKNGKLGKMPAKKDNVSLKKPSATIEISGDLSLIQRKFYNAFLFVAKKSLEQDPERRKFAVSLASLKEFFGIKTRNNERLKSSIRGLMRTIVEYNYLNKEKNMIFDRMATLLSEVKIGVKSNGKDGVIEFLLPDMIRESLIREDIIYANIDLLIIKALKSKYAVMLYELCKDYEKAEIPELTIEEFRKLFGIENKHKRMSDLKKRVLEPAVSEINSNPKVPFFVEYELISKTVMNEYTHIKFHVKPKPAELKDNIIGDKKVLEAEVKENSEVKDLLALIPPEHRRKTKVVSLVLGSVETKGKEYTKAQIEYINEKYKSGKIKNYVAYLKNAIEKDYAGFEEVEDIGFVTVDDAIGYRLNVTYKGKNMYVEIAHIEIKENLEHQGIGYDKERVYLVKFDNVKTGEVAFWHEFGEEKLFEWARKNIELRKKRRES